MESCCRLCSGQTSGGGAAVKQRSSAPENTQHIQLTHCSLACDSVRLSWNHPVEGCTSFSIRNNLPAPSSEKHKAKQRNQLCALSVSILTSATSVSTPAGFELKITSFDRTSVGECDRCRIEIRAVIVIFIRFRYDKKKV